MLEIIFNKGYNDLVTSDYDLICYDIQYNNDICYDKQYLDRSNIIYYYDVICNRGIKYELLYSIVTKLLQICMFVISSVEYIIKYNSI